jgi:type I restriction enzyme M protein
VVIGLPEKLLYGTSIATVVLVFRKTKRDDNVLFIDASQGYRDRKSRNHLGENDLRRILDTVKARKHVDKYAYLASRGDIAQNGYNLNISRYIQTFDDGTKIDLMAVRQEREQLAAQLSKLEQQFAACLRDLDL